MAVAAQPSAGGCGTYLESFPGPAPSAAHSSDHTAHVCNLEAPAHLHGGPSPVSATWYHTLTWPPAI